MGYLKKAVSGLLLAFTLIFVHVPGQAASHRTDQEISPREAAAMVQRRTGGQALGVKEAVVNGRKVYRVRVVTRDGRVRVFTVDAKSRK